MKYLQVLHPSEHKELHGKLKESQARGTIESALDQLSTALQEHEVEGVDLSGRPKNLYGVMRKMRDKQKGLNQVYDVRALRVIVKSKADCYRVLQQVTLTSDLTLYVLAYRCCAIPKTIFVICNSIHMMMVQYALKALAVQREKQYLPTF